MQTNLSPVNPSYNSYREAVIGNYIFDLWLCKTVLKQYVKRKSSKSKTKDLN